MNILIISASGRSIAESAQRAGWEFDVLDLFADWDLQQICHMNSGKIRRWIRIDDFAQVPDLIQGNNYDAAIISGGFENRLSLVRDLESHVRVLGPNSTDLARLQNSNSLKKIESLVVGCGGQFPPTEFEFLNCDPRKIWLRKNLAASGGQHVSIATSSSGIRESRIGCPQSEIVFQQRIFGDQVSALFLAGQGYSESQNDSKDDNLPFCRLLGCTRQLVGEVGLGAAPFAYCGSIGPVEIDTTVKNTIEVIGAAMAAEFRIAGIFGIDLIVNESGIWPVDINPRITASAEIFELASQTSNADATSFCIVSEHVDACLGLPAILKPVSFGVEIIGKAILFCQHGQKLTIDERIFQTLRPFFRGAMKSGIPQRFIADIPNPGTRIAEGEPILSLFTRGSSSSEIFQDLMRFAELLRGIVSSSKG